MSMEDGRAKAAPELNSLSEPNTVESFVEWYVVSPERSVRFAGRVQFRAIPSANKGRKCEKRLEKRHTPRGSRDSTAKNGNERACSDKEKAEGTVKTTAPATSTRWADMMDEDEEFQQTLNVDIECGRRLSRRTR